MSSSCQAIASAARLSAALSSWRAPGKCVWRVDRATGVHRAGSLQSHTTPRAHSGISSCDTTTVGTAGTGTSSPRARLRSAATAASARANHACTRSAYTPGRKSASIGISAPAAGAAGTSPDACPSGSVGRGSGLRAFARRRFPDGADGC
eukprot:2217875-Pleurochrysis_carterae.AAC.1